MICKVLYVEFNLKEIEKLHPNIERRKHRLRGVICRPIAQVCTSNAQGQDRRELDGHDVLSIRANYGTQPGEGTHALARDLDRSHCAGMRLEVLTPVWIACGK